MCSVCVYLLPFFYIALRFTQSSAGSSVTRPLQLPRVVNPFHYDLFLAYGLKPEVDFPFFGVVRIHVQAIRITSKITLHSLYLNVEPHKAVIEMLNKTQIEVTNTSFDVNSETLSLDLAKVLIPSENYTITIPFYGNLHNGTIFEGAYIGSYEVKHSKREQMVITKFEPTYARKAFPCFDEPDLKATFTISIAHPEKYTAISNMPLRLGMETNLMESHWRWMMILQKFDSYLDDYVWTTFDTTLRMSTYLVAFIISRYDYLKSSPNESRVPVRVWTRKDDIAMVNYAKNVSPRLLKFYENWFSVLYPLPKLDIAVVPSTACMENWGLITFEESTLYYDEKQSSVTDKYLILNTLAHEISHQWFGNLVTMNWWSDLWLNEGFACFMSNYGTDALEPKWLSTQLSVSERRRELLEFDASDFTHPVSVEVVSSNIISELFDTISYYKGEALIRMIMMFLGEKSFKKGITNYLTKYSYDNTDPSDLWEELTAVSRENGLLDKNVTVKDIMASWTNQKGFPLLNVIRNYETQRVAITQERFQLIKTEVEPNQVWWIPINVVCEGETPPENIPRLQWLSTNDKNRKPPFNNHCSKNDRWLLINAEMMAPCHVNYDDYNWQLLSYTLNHKENFTQISLLSRAQLIGDAFSLAWNNLLSYNITLNLVKYIQHESNLLPLQAAHDGLGKIYGVLKRSSHREVTQKYLRELIKPIYNLIGDFSYEQWTTPNDLLETKRNELVIAWACEVELTSCIDRALDLYNKWVEAKDPDKHNPIPADLLYTVGCVAASLGSLSEWEFLRERALASRLLTSRSRLLEAMACTRHIWLLNRQLDMVTTELSESQVTEATISLTAIIKNSVGYYLVRDLILQDLNRVYTALNRNDGLMSTAVENLLLEVTEKRDLDDLNNIIEKHPNILDKQDFGQACERAMSNIIWLSKRKYSALWNMMEIYSKSNRRFLFKHSGIKSEQNSSIEDIDPLDFYDIDQLMKLEMESNDNTKSSGTPAQASKCKITYLMFYLSFVAIPV